MSLVKLTNIGEETFEGVSDNQVYIIDPDKEGKSYVIVDEGVAKHWLGDWDLKDEGLKGAEKRRVELLNRPGAKYKIIVTPVKLEVRSEEVNPFKPKPVIVNDNVLVPEEAEFEDLLTFKATKPVVVNDNKVVVKEPEFEDLVTVDNTKTVKKTSKKIE